MPITFQYENNKQDVIITVTGIVTGEEFLHKMNELFSDEQAIRNYRSGLNDFTQLEKFNISPGQIISLAKLHNKASTVNPNIIVGFAINKPVIHGLVRIWMAYAAFTNWQVNIKKTLPEIENWINSKLAQNKKFGRK